MSKAADDRRDTATPPSRLETAQTRVADAASAAKNAASDALSSARDAAAEKFGVAREATHDLREKAADQLEGNPLMALVGGLALGAVAAAVLPRSPKETQLFGALGTRLTDAAREAAGAARSTGKDSLDELGLSQDKARETVSKLFGDILRAAGNAATAGASAAKDSAAGSQS